jgi:hypothetical protein
MAWTYLGRVAGRFAFFSLYPLKARAIAFGFSDLSVAVNPGASDGFWGAGFLLPRE